MSFDFFKSDISLVRNSLKELKISHTEALILFYMQSHSDRFNIYIAHITQWLGSDKRTAKNAVISLSDKGFLNLKKSIYKGNPATLVKLVDFNKKEGCKSTSLDEKKGCKNTPLRGVKIHPKGCKNTPIVEKEERKRREGTVACATVIPVFSKKQPAVKKKTELDNSEKTELVQKIKLNQLALMERYSLGVGQFTEAVDYYLNYLQNASKLPKKPYLQFVNSLIKDWAGIRGRKHTFKEIDRKNAVSSVESMFRDGLL